MAKVLKKRRKKKVLKKKKIKRLILKKVPKKKKIKKLKIRRPKKPVGRWCSEKAGALPFPIECHYMQRLNRSCGECNNTVDYRMWRAGAYVKIEDEIDRGIDFTDPTNIPVFMDVEVTKWSKSTTKSRRLKKRKKNK